MKAVLALVVIALVALAQGSSHSEAPGTAKSPQADHTDFYMFRSYEPSRISDDYVTFLVNVQGLQSPFAGPNYFSLSDQHFYEIYIDNTGDVIEDIVYQFMYGTTMGGKLINTTTRPDDFDCAFTPQQVTIKGGISLNINGNDVTVPLKTVGPVTAADNSNLNWFETYTVTAIQGNRSSTTTFPFTQVGSGIATFTKPFDNAGQKTFPDYNLYANQYIYDVNVPLCPVGNTKTGKVFVGQRLESFFINLGGIFDLINFVPIPGFPGAIAQNPLNNDLAQKNIDTFALEVPSVCLTQGGVATGVIGAWGVIRELLHIGTDHVPGKQVSRLANPLVNELVIGLYSKYVYNMDDPSNDAQFATFILYPTMPEIVNILFGSAVNAVLGTNLTTIAPATPRNDLLAAFALGIDGLNQFGDVPSDIMRLNLSIAPTAQASQQSLGVIAGDAAGFPNGRRPGDDAVDIGLQVLVAGVLCTLNIGCTPDQAPIGAVKLTDGAPISAADFQNAFPYLQPPLAGALNAGHDYTSPSGGLSVPSVFATFLALAAGFLISIAFFRF